MCPQNEMRAVLPTRQTTLGYQAQEREDPAWGRSRRSVLLIHIQREVRHESAWETFWRRRQQDESGEQRRVWMDAWLWEVAGRESAGREAAATAAAGAGK